MNHPALAARGPQAERVAPVIVTVRSAAEIERIRSLFTEYAASLPMDLAFQRFEAELAGLPGAYAAPRGALFLAHDGEGGDTGCLGVRPLDVAGICEIKRLYVRPTTRGSGAGRALARAALHFAEVAGYREARLDTFPSMVAAIALYRDLGFAEIAPYRDNLGQDLLSFGKRLRG